MSDISMTDRPQARRPDYVLLVEETWSPGERVRLRYRWQTSGTAAMPLSAPSESAAFAAGERRLDGLHEAFARLRKSDSPRGALRRLESLARGLTTRLVPAPVLECLSAASAQHPTLWIVSDFSWVPWELLWIEDGGVEAGGTHWCRVFSMTRWLPDRESPMRLPMARFAFLAAGRADRSETDRERLRICSEAAPEAEVVTREDAVLRALDDGEFDVYHFAGHAHAGGDRADDWALELARGERLTASDVRGMGAGFAAARPFVFLNACGSARGGESWGEASGLSAAFVQAGAGAVVGASWPVTDVLAAELAVELYRRLFAGRPLADACREAREAVRALAPDDPTWLAYAVFGHPLAQRGQGNEAADEPPRTVGAAVAADAVPAQARSSPIHALADLGPSSRAPRLRSRWRTYSVMAVVVAIVVATWWYQTKPRWGSPGPFGELEKPAPIGLTSTTEPPSTDFGPRVQGASVAFGGAIELSVEKFYLSPDRQTASLVLVVENRLDEDLFLAFAKGNYGWCEVFLWSAGAEYRADSKAGAGQLACAKTADPRGVYTKIGAREVASVPLTFLAADEDEFVPEDVILVAELARYEKDGREEFMYRSPQLFSESAERP